MCSITCSKALCQHFLVPGLWSAPLSILASQRVAYGIFALQWAKEERDLGGGVLLHFTSVAQSKVCHRGFQKFPNWSAGWKRGASFERPAPDRWGVWHVRVCARAGLLLRTKSAARENEPSALSRQSVRSCPTRLLTAPAFSSTACCHHDAVRARDKNSERAPDSDLAQVLRNSLNSACIRFWVPPKSSL